MENFTASMRIGLIVSIGTEKRLAFTKSFDMVPLAPIDKPITSILPLILYFSLKYGTVELLILSLNLLLLFEEKAETKARW